MVEFQGVLERLSAHRIAARERFDAAAKAAPEVDGKAGEDAGPRTSALSRLHGIRGTGGAMMLLAGRMQKQEGRWWLDVAEDKKASSESFYHIYNRPKPNDEE